MATDWAPIAVTIVLLFGSSGHILSVLFRSLRTLRIRLRETRFLFNVRRNTKTHSQAQQITKDDRSTCYAVANVGCTCVRFLCKLPASPWLLGCCCLCIVAVDAAIPIMIINVGLFLYLRAYTIYKYDGTAHANDFQCLRDNRVSPSLMYPSFMSKPECLLLCRSVLFRECVWSVGRWTVEVGWLMQLLHVHSVCLFCVFCCWRVNKQTHNSHI